MTAKLTQIALDLTSRIAATAEVSASFSFDPEEQLSSLPTGTALPNVYVVPRAKTEEFTSRGTTTKTSQIDVVLAKKIDVETYKAGNAEEIDALLELAESIVDLLRTVALPNSEARLIKIEHVQPYSKAWLKTAGVFVNVITLSYIE